MLSIYIITFFLELLPHVLFVCCVSCPELNCIDDVGMILSSCGLGLSRNFVKIPCQSQGEGVLEIKGLGKFVA